MKKIGLIGGTGPESTIVYYKQITTQVQKITGNFPNLAIESLSVYNVLSFVDNEDYSGLTQYLLKGIDNLMAAGAEMVALTGITPHLVIDELKKESPVPVISMLDSTKEYLKNHGLRNVLLTGTAQTLKAQFFQKDLQNNGFEVILPSDDEIEYMGKKIENELELGKVVPQTQKQFAQITQQSIDNNAVQAVILGCTELPLIYDQIPLSVPKVDVMREHIKKLVSLITEK